MPTGISWADDTWNPSVGCTRVSRGCDGCFAIRDVHRMAGHPNPIIREANRDLVVFRDGRLDWDRSNVRLLPERLDRPLRWRRPRRVFVDSLSDLFHPSVPTEFIVRVFAVMADAADHQFLVLTKRHDRMRSLLTDQCRCGRGHPPGEHFRSAMEWAATPHSPTYVTGLRPGLYHRMTWPLPNVALGVSVEDQHWAGIRIDALFDTPAAIRWISAEPLLGSLDIAWYLGGHWRCPWCRFEQGAHIGNTSCLRCRKRTYPPPYRSLDWVVAGGESGSWARPMHPAWARQLRDQCAAAGVPFHFKQWGEWAPAAGRGADYPDDLRMLVDPDVPGGRGMALEMARVGKKKAGRELDGVVHDAYPEPAR